MIKAEMKRAFCSKPFWVACVITLAMLAFGSSDCLYISPATEFTRPHAWWSIYLYAVFLGMKTMLPVFYPIVVMIPYVLSYRRDRDSGYQQLMLLKTKRPAYLRAKVLAVASSAFAAILLPGICWIPVCRLLGVTDPSYDLDRHSINFALSLYDQHPGWYLVMYAVHAAILGAVFAIFGLGLSAVVKNRYLALLLPFCYCIFSSSVLDSLVSKSFAALDLLPLQMYYYTEAYPLGFWTVPIYEVVLTAVGLALFWGGDYYAGKA